jgi:hypothetical protein
MGIKHPQRQNTPAEEPAALTWTRPVEPAPAAGWMTRLSDTFHEFAETMFTRPLRSPYLTQKQADALITKCSHGFIKINSYAHESGTRKILHHEIAVPKTLMAQIIDQPQYLTSWELAHKIGGIKSMAKPDEKHPRVVNGGRRDALLLDYDIVGRIAGYSPSELKILRNAENNRHGKSSGPKPRQG